MEPIRTEKDIKTIIQLFSGHPRDLLLFVMGMGKKEKNTVTLLDIIPEDLRNESTKYGNHFDF